MHVQKYTFLACATAMVLSTLSLVVGAYASTVAEAAKIELKARRARVDKIEEIIIRVETLEAEQESRWQKLLSTQNTDNKQP